MRHQAKNLKRRKVLPGIGRLVERDRRLTFDDKSIKILVDEDRDRLGKCPSNARFGPVHHVENAQRLVLEDRVRV